MLFKNPGKVFIEISEPLNLMTFVQQQAKRNLGNDHLCLMVRRNLLRQINRHRQSITGPQLKSIEEIKESILTRDRLSRYMRQHAKSKDISIQKTRKKADAYLKEIAARYSPSMIKMFAGFLTWIFKLMFDGFTVNQQGLNRVKSMSQKGPLILMPCHKSHIDYLLLSYIMNQNNMPCPFVAAGKNLSFWPLGPIFRGSGAFFLRRTFKGMPLYAKVFSEYIHKILEEGFNLELFVEGGRSRTGKLLMPKLGMLSMLMEAYKNGACEDLIFVPVFIGYDRVLEESAYLHELEGGQKSPESFSQMMGARKFLKKKYGRIYVKFNEPFTLKNFLRQNDIDLTEADSRTQKNLCRVIGHKVLNAIDKTTVVTPHALVAAAILNFSENRFSYDRLLSQVETYIHYLQDQGVTLSDTLVLDHGYAIEQAVDSYVQRKFIILISGEKSKPYTEAQFQVNIAKRPVLDYYKNNSIAFFVPAAYTALGILGKNAFQFTASDLHASYTLLENFFRFEFTYDANYSADVLVRKSLKAFINDAILMPHATLPDTYNLTAEGYKKLKGYARFLKTYFESYLVVSQYMIKNPSKSGGTKESLKKIQSLGNRMYKKQEIELKEALSKANYRNAIALFKAKDPSGNSPDKRLSIFKQTIEHYLECMTK
jgi:glycerol-3-phosphate O-acyltransferase